MEPGDGIYDDGEWISWDYLNHQIEFQEAYDAAIKTAPPKGEKLLAMIEAAKGHYRTHRTRSPLLGEIGELYAEEQYGIARHKPCPQGSDGKLGNDFVEIKTITPGKTVKFVRVKRKGNFNKLILVRIWGNFRMEARMVERKRLPKGRGKYAKILWDEADFEE